MLSLYAAVGLSSAMVNVSIFMVGITTVVAGGSAGAATCRVAGGGDIGSAAASSSVASIPMVVGVTVVITVCN